MTRGEAQKILEKILSSSSADETFASLTETNDSFQPFSSNQLSPAGIRRLRQFTITVRKGDHVGSFTSNKFDDESIKSAVTAVEAIALNYPPLQPALSFPGKQEITGTPLFKQSNESISAEWRIRVVKKFIEQARQKNLLAHGNVTTADTVNAVMSSKGLFTFQPSSTAYARLRVISANGRRSGFAEQWNYDVKRLDIDAIASRAISYCTEASTVHEIKPAKYDVVLAPSVVADFLFILMQQFNQQSILDKQSFLRKMDGSDHIGTKMFGENITVSSDPYSQTLPSFPFSAEGEKITAQTWIKNGVINEIVRPRAIAQQEERSSIPFPTNIIFEGGTDSFEDLIKKTSNAVLITNVSNLQIADPTNCLLTGVTRDGLFQIEEGKITNALKNIRFSETPVYMLKAADILSKSEQASGRYSTFPMLVPAIKMIGFQFIAPTELV